MSYVRLAMNPMVNNGAMNGSVRREIEQLLHDVMPARAGNVWTPVGNGYEDATGFTLEFEVPGFAPDQLEITAQDGMLVIRGERPATEQKEVRQIFAERPVGTFERQLRLPKTADFSNISASYAHGVLSVRVEKLPTMAPRKISINLGEGVSTTPAQKNGQVSTPTSDK